MAERPVFKVDETKDGLIVEEIIEFEYFSGFSKEQKQKSINSLHAAANVKDIYKILEVSTKSSTPIGVC